MPPKQYGLIKRKKPETKLVKSKLSFFADDDEGSADESPLDKMAEKKRIEAELQKTSKKKIMNKQTQVTFLRLFNFLIKRDIEG